MTAQTITLPVFAFFCVWLWEGGRVDLKPQTWDIESVMKDRCKALALFHPLIQKWFRERLGAPTDIQAKAWPEIARGSHVLATAPTGSGKTLTAFLWAINVVYQAR